MRTNVWVLLIVAAFCGAVAEETRRLLRTVPIKYEAHFFFFKFRTTLTQYYTNRVGEEDINIDLYEGDVIRDVAANFLNERGIPAENLDTLVQLLSQNDVVTQQQEEEQPEEEQQIEESKQEEEQAVEESKEEEVEEETKSNLRSSAEEVEKKEEKKDEKPLKINADDSAFYKRFAAMKSVTCLENGACYRTLKTHDSLDKKQTTMCNFDFEVWTPSTYPNEKPIQFSNLQKGFWVNTLTFESGGRKSKWEASFPFLNEVSKVMELGDEFEILAPTSLCAEQWLKRMKVDIENTPEVIFRIHKSSCDRATHKLYARAKPKTRKYPRHEEL